MTFGPWRGDNQVADDAFAIRPLDCILGVLANGENWRFGRHQFFISDLKKNVAWAQPRGVRWAAFMNILKHPPLFPIEFVPHEGGGDGVAAGDLPALGMAKTSVAGLQFGHEILYLLLEFFIVGALQDLVSPGFRQLFPIRPVHAGIEMLPRHKFAHAGINLLFRLQVETHWTLNGIGDPPSPRDQGGISTKIDKPTAVKQRLLRGFSDAFGTPLHDLPHTRDEIIDVSKILGENGVILLGSNATETAFKSEPLWDFK